MSRRKQLYPKHIESEDELASWLKNGGHCFQTRNAEEFDDDDASDILTEDEHICGKCRAEFLELSDFLLHKKLCARKRLVLVVATDHFQESRYTSDLEPADEKSDEVPPSGSRDPQMTGLTDKSTKLAPIERELSPPGNNNNSQETALNLSRGGVGVKDASRRTLVTTSVSVTSNLPQPHYSLLPDTHVALETLQNTRVAVAQHGHNTRSTELGALQSALYTLQQQQLLQLQIIQQLHAHILGNAGAPPAPGLLPSLAAILPPSALTGTPALTPPQSSDISMAALAATNTTQHKPISMPIAHPISTAASTTEKDRHSTSSSASIQSNLLLPNKRDPSESPPVVRTSPLQPLSLPPPPPPSEPNTLELLQRHTEQALQNTMSGGSFLLNGINGLGGCDSLRLKKKSEDGKEEALFRHRCKFCGKVFGSDSALQIHLRSHTGERPFKCNVCGNRFSTKGNLKVHFQRHKAKYPHVKMNPNPVPEHLDALHPPLEPPSASSVGPGSPSSSNMMMMLASTNSNCSNASNSINVSGNISEPDRSSTPQLAEDLTVRPNRNESPTEITVQCDPTLLDRSRSPSLNDVSNLTAATDTSVDGYAMDDAEADVKLERELDQDSMASSGLGPHDDFMDDDDAYDDEIPREDEIKRSVSAEPYYNPNRMSTYSPFMHSSGPTFPSFFQNSPFSGALTMSPFAFNSLSTTANLNTTTTTTSANEGDQNGGVNNPALYQDLLPKPGSVDSNWETLMEVTKTSETSKLQQLVDNIEHKLSDPNQCIICHRVLSCKSALQMHYRTHTGERPFKCKICGRAFTTKGNLKTHMGVHRVKPPLRVLHQCPVCHKQFTNSLVLQQHIRMHTGLRADLLNRADKLSMPLLQPSFSRSSTHASQQSHNSQAGILMSPPPPTMHLALSDPNNRPKSCSPASTINQSPPSQSPDSVIKDTASVASTKDSPSKAEESERRTPDNNSPSPAPTNRSSSPPPLTPVKEEMSSPPMVSMPSVSAASACRESPLRNLSPGFERSVSMSMSMSMQHSTFTTSLAALENHVKTINTAIPQPLPFGPFGIALPVSGYQRYDDPSSFAGRNHPIELSTRSKSPAQSSAYSSSPATSRAASEGSTDERLTPGVAKSESPLSVSLSMSSMVSPSSNVLSSSNRSESGALDLTPRASVLTGHASNEMMVSPRMFPSPLGGLPFPPTPGRSNTTCQICFKTFACNSALEIHYRSHTKERPFKCHVCDRGFSTKGNMKQHMLTHKIRDLPSQLFTQTTTPPTPTSTDSRGSVNHEDSQNDSSISNTLKELENLKRQQSRDHHHGGGGHHPSHHHHHHHHHHGGSHHHNPVANPIPKRPPGMPKHMCHVCNKPFSSGSALQIHMRTHTGDKPFKCSICGRAFTTKGNLKVHMGTHMWSNGSSRRGRRMSLELPPLPLPPGSKPGDLVHHRPDLYFQYFNPAYLNGMTPPKMNEISVIQTAGISNGSGGIPMSMHQQHVMNQMMANHRQPNNGNNNNNNQDLSSVNRASASSTPDSSKTSNGDYRLSESKRRPTSSPQPRSHDRSSPLSQRHTPTSIGLIQHPPTSIGPNWGWKIACNVCNKICVSSTELEIHLKTHYKQENSDARVDKSSPENLTV